MECCKNEKEREKSEKSKYTKKTRIENKATLYRLTRTKNRNVAWIRHDSVIICSSLRFAMAFSLLFSFHPPIASSQEYGHKENKTKFKTVFVHEYCLENFHHWNFVCGTTHPACGFAYTLQMIIISFFVFWIYTETVDFFTPFLPFRRFFASVILYLNPVCLFFFSSLFGMQFFQVLNNIDRTVISKVQPMEPKICYTNIKTWIHQVRLSVDRHYRCVKRHHFHWSRQIDAMSRQQHQIHKIDIAPVVSL